MISPLLFILFIDELINTFAVSGTPGIFVNECVIITYDNVRM